MLEAQRGAERDSAEWRDSVAALEARLGSVDRELEQMRERQRSIDTRIGENASSARVVRDEVLGIAERAALLEDAVARLAESREQGDVSLRLNEIEFLLQLGEERLRLFGDAPAARAAFELADEALRGLDEPSLATLQQTLTVELQSLRTAPDDPRPLLRRRIGDALNALPDLPLAADQQLQPAANESRLWQVLDRLVTVRRISESQSALTPIERASRNSSLRLHLGLALAALETRDGKALEGALGFALRDFDSLYDSRAAAVIAARAAITEARQTPLQAPRVEVGTTLREIRALRATRDAGRRQQAPLPSSVAPPAAALDVEQP